MGPAIRANNCHAGSTLYSAEIESPIVRLKLDSFYARQRSDKLNSAIARCVRHVCIHLG